MEYYDTGYSVKMDGAGLSPMTSSLSLNSTTTAGAGNELCGSPVSMPGKAPTSASSQSLTITPLLTTISQQQSEQRLHQQQQQQQQNSPQQRGDTEDRDGSGDAAASAMPSGADATALLNQMNQLGPSDRCTPTQAQAMGQQLLSIIAYHERNKITLPGAS